MYFHFKSPLQSIVTAVNQSWHQLSLSKMEQSTNIFEASFKPAGVKQQDISTWLYSSFSTHPCIFTLHLCTISISPAHITISIRRETSKTCQCQPFIHLSCHQPGEWRFHPVTLWWNLIFCTRFICSFNCSLTLGRTTQCPQQWNRA